MIWFDAHLDLACLAVNGRDMNTTPEKAGGPWQPASVTLPSLLEGGVRVALATIFTEPDGKDREGYPAGDVEAAYKRGRAQLEVYLTWQDQGHIAIDLPRLLKNDPHIGEVRGGMGVGQVVPPSLEQRLSRSANKAPLHMGILVENADPIRSPEDLPWWKERGVVAIGLAWAKPSRYAMGNMTDRAVLTGLTPIGVEMVKAMDALGIIHDVSHLSDRAMDELLALTNRPVVASHSNCRALLTGDMGPDGSNQRQLRDESIREVTSRGGVIGLNLFHKFIRDSAGGAVRANVMDAVRHVEHICEIAGSRDHVGLGSDMDGGLTGEELPLEITRPSHLSLLADALDARGWSESEVQGFVSGNWVRFFEQRRNIRDGVDSL